MSNINNLPETTNPVIDKVVEALKSRKITGLAAEDAAHARKLILDIVPTGAVIGIGDSSSVRQIQAVKALEERGNRVINGFDPYKKIQDLKSHFENGFWPMLEATVCDVFLTGSNAITEDGRDLGWDRSWPEERINRIIRRHEQHMVMCPMPECVFEKGNNDKLWEMARQKRRGNVWP